MAETDASATTAASPGVPESVAEERPKTAGFQGSPHPATAEEPAASNTKGILRDAIQKVMEEIAFHEREAKKHLQQADALRKDLRESFAFLQDREGKGKATPVAVEKRSEPVALPNMPEKAKTLTGPERRPRGNPKKKRGGGKAKEG